jgi:hypothetical protein
MQGAVEEVNNLNKTLRVMQSDENEYWYQLGDVRPVLIDDNQLKAIGFHQLGREGEFSVYEKGPFTLKISFSNPVHPAVLHYRDETRQVVKLFYMHELQHHYKAMTNFELWGF